MANTYLTKESLSWIWSKIKTALSGKADASSVTTALAGKKNTQSAVSDPSASGTSLTFISGITQNAQGVISPSKKTVSTMGAATSGAAGTAGLVPAPAAGKQAQFLRGDGTWQTPANTKNTAGSTDSSEKLFLIGATSQAANPQTYSQDTAYVGTDGCLYSGGTKVLTAHQDISGKKSTQAAVSDPTASGTGVEFISGISQNAQGVISPSKKTVRTMGAASSSAAGSTGLVPAPAKGAQAQFLRGDATWQTLTDTKNTAGSTDSSAKLFLIGATSQAANPQTYSHDTAYVGTDGCLYSGGKKVLTDHQAHQTIKQDGVTGATANRYATCSTAADTAAKTATITTGTFTLETGATVYVKFTNSNTVVSPTLNVNSTGAKSIMRYGTTAAGTSAATSWTAGSVVPFTYDGTNWIMQSAWDNNTTYSNASLGQGYGTCTTAAATAAKVVTLSSYALTTGGIVSVKFTNSVPASATMNINSKGAKAIFYKGAAITAGVIEAGDLATFIYDGTHYHLLSIDHWHDDLSDLSNQITNISGLSGKKILIIGDSISDEDLYPNCWVKYFRPMAESVGATVTNYSLQGRTIGIYTGATNYLMNVLSGIPAGTYDEIVVFLGTNDWINQVTLGNVHSSDTNSVGNNIGMFYKWKRDNQPNARVTFITPLRAQVENDVRHKLLQFYAITIASAALWCGFNVIDAHSFAPLLTTMNIRDWTRDGIHPPDAYSPYLARFILNNLMSRANSVGLNNFKTTLAIGDVDGNATRVNMHYSGDGIVFYDVSNFVVSGTGNIKLADLPEECQTFRPVYGVCSISTGGAITYGTLFSTSEALYIYTSSSITGATIAGSTCPGFVKHFTLTNISY